MTLLLPSTTSNLATALQPEPLTAPLPDLTWRNCEESGRVETLPQLAALISRVGTAPSWQWLVVKRSEAPWPYAQACGHALTGLIVEIGDEQTLELVAPRFARSSPLRNVGVFGWLYLAHTDELHTVGDTFGIFADWLLDRIVSSAFTLRDPSNRGASRIGHA